MASHPVLKVTDVQPIRLALPERSVAALVLELEDGSTLTLPLDRADRLNSTVVHGLNEWIAKGGTVYHVMAELLTALGMEGARIEISGIVEGDYEAVLRWKALKDGGKGVFRGPADVLAIVAAIAKIPLEVKREVLKELYGS